MANTPNRNYVRPSEAATLAIAKSRFQALETALDADVAAALAAAAERALADHTHDMAEIAGLEDRFEQTEDIAAAATTLLAAQLAAQIDTHTHTADDISDATTQGKAILKAASYNAVKALLSLAKGDVGLGNVDNTSDVNKPISTAVAAALDVLADDIAAVPSPATNGIADFEAVGANRAVVAADRTKYLRVTGNRTLTFATAASLGTDWFCYIENAESETSTNVVTLNRTNPSTIDGLTTYKMYSGEVRLFTCDGTTITSVVLKSFKITRTASETITTPPGYNYVGLDMLGGGAGGRSGATAASGSSKAGGPGGGGGARILDFVATTLLAATAALTIGAGGASNVAGGDTSFGGVTAPGGDIGAITSNVNTTAGPGGLGTSGRQQGSGTGGVGGTATAGSAGTVGTVGTAGTQGGSGGGSVSSTTVFAPAAGGGTASSAGAGSAASAVSGALYGNGGHGGGGGVTSGAGAAGIGGTATLWGVN